MNTEELAIITQRIIPTLVSTASITLKYFNTYVEQRASFETKTDSSPITIADIETEHRLGNILQDTYPNFGIIGEEGTLYKPNARYIWVIDPIDGTHTFIRGVPLYTTLLGLFDTFTGRALFGCIYAPATRELLYAYLGGGAYFQHISMEEVLSARFDERMNAKSCVTRCSAEITTLKNSLILSYDWVRAMEKYPAILPLMKKAQITRTWADGYAYLLLATSRAQGIIDVNMNLWDIVAVYAVIREAGAHTCTTEGETLETALPILHQKYLKSQSAKLDIISCANEALYKETMYLLRDFA